MAAENGWRPTKISSAPLYRDYNSIEKMSSGGAEVAPRDEHSRSSSPLTRAPAPSRLRYVSAEPAMFLFMLSALVKFPVFQSLLYEKACLNSARFENASLCANISAVHKDMELQKAANHLLLASSLCLLGPAIPVALLLGAFFDAGSTRRAVVIPLCGLLLADLNYLLQALFMDWNAYWLLLSDLVFGAAGGFTSISGLLFAYSVKVTPLTYRSVRVAIMEGAMGLGGMCGYILSGQLRQAFGYTWVFALLTLLHLVILLYVFLFMQELNPKNRAADAGVENGTHETILGGQQQQPDTAQGQSLVQIWRQRFAGIVHVYRAERDPDLQKCLNIVLFALALELLSFAGLMDILFSFLRFQLQWSDKEYGWFSGLNMGLSSLVVVALYPLLRKRLGIGDLRLAAFGLVTKVAHILVLAFTSSTLVAMLSLAPSMFGRFITTGMRAMASACVRQHEQGKVFALISLLEGLSFLVASVLFNGLYPYTLKFFAGTMLLIVSVLLLIPVALLAYIDLSGTDKKLRQH